MIAALDRRAYAEHTSRSALANEILAESLGVMTAEKQMQVIFSTLSEEMADYRMPEQVLGNTLVFQRQIEYRYKPTLQYSVVLTPGHTAFLGFVRFQTRTKSQTLQDIIARVFSTWMACEERYLPYAKRIEYQDDQLGRLHRTLMRVREVPEEEQGIAIAEYLTVFDLCLNAYFARLKDSAMAEIALEKSFMSNLHRIMV